MIFGVKVIHTYAVGQDDRRYYEELILRVNADSFDDAYRKADCYMADTVFEYTNPNGETVKTLDLAYVDCFLAFEPDGDVQELFSSFSVNNSSLSEEESYNAITRTCGENELRSLRNMEFQ